MALRHHVYPPASKSTLLSASPRDSHRRTFSSAASESCPRNDLPVCPPLALSSILIVSESEREPSTRPPFSPSFFLCSLWYDRAAISVSRGLAKRASLNYSAILQSGSKKAFDGMCTLALCTSIWRLFCSPSVKGTHGARRALTPNTAVSRPD